MNEVPGWKLFRLRPDGTLGPLFINRQQVVELGTWLFAEPHPTTGFALRPGWHATLSPSAPHLKTELKSGEIRVWREVLLRGVKLYERPESQGGTWVLAQEMMVV